MDAEQYKNLTTPSPDGPQFKPAKGYLRVMGILVVFAGLLLCATSWFYVVRMPEMMSLEQFGSQGDKMIPLMSSFGMGIGVVGVCTIVLGVGSIALRRWARDLLYATGWLIIGLVGLFAIGAAMNLPNQIAMMKNLAVGIGAGGGSSGSSVGGMESIMMVVLIIGLVLYGVVVVVPGIVLVLVYRSKNVELTTRYFDQTPHWTEKCHVFVLVWWLLLVLALIISVTMLFGSSDWIASLGILPSTLIVNIVLVMLAAILLGIAFGVSKNASWAWWGSLVYLVAYTGISFYFIDAIDMDALVDMSTFSMVVRDVDDANEEMDEMMRSFSHAIIRTGFYSGMLALVILIGFLIMIRKHFFANRQRRR